jgi:hypothetical protein
MPNASELKAPTNGVGGRYCVSTDEWARGLTDSDLIRRLDGLFQVTGEGLSPAMWKELRRRFGATRRLP